MKKLLLPFFILTVLFTSCKKNNGIVTIPIPAAPTNVSVNVNSASSITIRWTDNAINETEYAVYRVIDNAYRRFVLPANTTSFTDTTVYTTKPIKYSVAASNSSGSSEYVTSDGSPGVITLSQPIITSISTITNTFDSITVSCTLQNIRDTGTATAGFYWIDKASVNASRFSILVNDGIIANTGIKNGTTFRATISTKPNTTYRIVAYAKNSLFTSISDETQVLTPIKTAPIITAYPSFINYTLNPKVLLDSLANNGLSDVTARGIVWSMVPNPTLANNVITTSVFRHSTEINLPTFPQSSTVYIREYATNAIGTSYSLQTILKTPVPLNNASIGDVYDGGVIFYFLKPGDAGYDPNVKHGFIVAIPTTKLPWYGPIAGWGPSSPIIGTDTALFTGENNTNLILATPSANNFQAVSFIRNTSYWPSGNWFLPSKAELTLMISNLQLTNPFYLDLLANSFGCRASYSSSEVFSNRDSIWHVGILNSPSRNYFWAPVSKARSFLNTFAVPIKRF
jgi:hypothetical protein